MSVGAENMTMSGQSEVAQEYSIRSMAKDDLSEVIEIEKEAYSHPWTVGIFRDCLRVGYSCWVMIKDQSVVGYGIVMLAAGEAHVLNVCIQPEQQHKGLGRQLLNHLMEKARLSGIDMILLEVRRSNQVAIDLYIDEGFHELGVRRNYYPAQSGREDAIIYARYLAPKTL